MLTVGRVSWSQFKRRWRPSRRLEPITNSRGEVPVAFLQRDHLHHRNAIEEIYVEAIASARDEVIVANAYFFPSRRLREAFAAAVRRGVRVRLLLQGRAEYWFNHYASRALYADLLRAGVEIHEYTRSHLHAKVAVVDGEWMTVGSSNIEPFSLLLAKEANVVVNHARTATVLHDSLLAEMQTGARPVLREQWESLPLWERVQCRAALRLAHLALTLSMRGAERRFI
ncbi:MAG: hypothetical protein FJY37_17435 [Betaproteobacteria bacterium]|nr:hypothetical protein [Betaproteobacteria bacterium]